MGLWAKDKKVRELYGSMAKARRLGNYMGL